MEPIFMTPNLLLALFLYTNYSAALPFNCGKPHLQDFRNIVQKTKLLGAEERMTFQQYADSKGLSVEAVERQFSATGTIKCEGRGEGTAQLTNSNSVITTARHIFYDDNCRRAKNLACKLYLYKNGNSYDTPIPVDLSTLIVGPCSPSLSGDSDWAVVRLKKPADEKKYFPYQTPDQPPELTLSSRFTQISGATSNFQNGGSHPRNVAECPPISRDPNMNQVNTTCDSGPGTSGAALLLDFENSSPTIAAILSGGLNKADANTAVIVDQPFIDAVKSLAGQ